MAEINPQSAIRNPQLSGVVVPHKPTFRQRIGAWIVFIFIRSVALTLRCKWIDRSGFYDKPQASPVILCTWHNRLALVLHAYFGHIKKRNNTAGLVAMIRAAVR